MKKMTKDWTLVTKELPKSNGKYEVYTSDDKIVECEFNNDFIYTESSIIYWRPLFNLDDVMKKLKLTSKKKLPTIKEVKNWLKGTEFEIEKYNSKSMKDCMKYIEKIIKIKIAEKKEEKNSEKIFFYMYVGGTPELSNKIKIDINDHLLKKQLTPKGCDKYCTENQIGKPQNWVKLPPILLPQYDMYEDIKLFLNKSDVLTKVDTNVFEYTNSMMSIVDYIKYIRKEIVNKLEDKWFDSKFGLTISENIIGGLAKENDLSKIL